MTETLQALHALHAEMRAQRLSQEHLTNSVLTALQRLKEPKKETLILGPGGFTYESEGYPFNALVVSDNLNGTDIEITERGQTYTYTLQAGWNVLNVSDGAYLTNATAISVMLVRDTRELFATFGTRVTVENASSNPVKTQLTGSNATVGNVGIINGNAQQSVLGPYTSNNNDNQQLASFSTMPVVGMPYLYNGTSWDRNYNNTQGTLLASAARTAIATSSLTTNYNSKGIVIYLNVTAASGSGGLQIQIISKDPVTQNPIQHNANPTAITATGIYAYVLYPGVSAPDVAGSYNVQQRTSDILPREFQIQVAVGDNTSYTYSIGYALIN